MTYSRIDLGKYIVLSIWFGCNNDCTICMLSDFKTALPPISFDLYKKVLADIRKDGRFENLILSGAEVTTFDSLKKYVQYAAALECFRKIQIQTNGRRLSDKGYARQLVDCGVNEFFISIHGLEAVHDSVTRRQGAFRETIAGLSNLADLGVNVIVNSVLTRLNLHDIPALMMFLTGTNASEIHLWNFYPMERTDSRDMVVSLAEFRALLQEVLPVVSASGKPLILKSFPECLAAGPLVFFDSIYPETVLPDRFWRAFSACGFGTCVYRETCSAWQCWGLSSAYIHKYGDERKLLSPIT